MVLLSFMMCLIGFVVVGTLSVRKSQATSQDYLLAGQDVKPWLAGLSAVATNSSGYMFMGLIGYTYTYGLQSIWLMVGWIFGDLIASFFVHKKLRAVTEERKVLSFAGVLSRWTGEDHNTFRWIGGIITIAFLGTYAAAQLNAGSKALHVLLGWNYSMGAVVGAVIVLLYCFAGGIRASIWTDAAQSFVMIFAMGLLAVVAVSKLGGMGPMFESLGQVSSSYMNVFPGAGEGSVFMAALLFVAGWFFAGFGVVGQPHIMVRFMALDKTENMSKVKVYYYGWYIVFVVLTYLAGFAARLLIPEVSQFDAELALPTLAAQLFPEVLVGLVLAGLFSATISTADSQILSCTAAVTQDLSMGKGQSIWTTKMATVGVTLIALLIALFGNESVFGLVVVAWSALACAFGPLLFVLSIGEKPKEIQSILMLVGGLAAMFIWRQMNLSDMMYEVAPGMIAGLLCYYLSKMFIKRQAT